MSESAGPTEFGRVTDDGTVYVFTPDGERRVGQVPDVDPSDAMAFFVRRFQTLETEVNLLTQRIGNGSLSPQEAAKSIDHLKTSITEANAVGDLAGLITRLEELTPELQAAQEARRAERIAQNEATKAAKEQMVAEAERIAAGRDWRGGVNRFRALLEEWKKFPRIDKATDDELWHRFSAARTTYTRNRKSQFAADNARREQARRVKEEIISRAREIASSQDWTATAAEFRELMAEWKAAGGAPRDVEDKLWKEFRGLQDQFFDARSAAFNAEESSYRENLTAKQALLDEAEKTIVPVTDIKASRAAYRDFLARYNEHGRVPRDQIRSLENRVRALENAIKAAEEAEWKRTDPEARKRAQDTVEMFEAQIAKLTAQVEAAEKTGDTRKATKAKESIATYTTWMEQARKALDEFTD
mgnify:FL=1